MKKEWKILGSESCANCRANLEVFSDNLEEDDDEFEQFVTDGDIIRCTSECGFESHISVYNGEAYVNDENILAIEEDE